MPQRFPDFETPTTINGPARDAEFLRNLAATYRDLYACAVSIVGDRNDAEDVIQEVCVVLWEKYEEFEPGTNFRKWAMTVTFNCARSFARKRRRQRGTGFGEEAISRIVLMRTAASELLELRRELIRDCIDKMSSSDRHFLSDCYRSSTSLVELAARKGKTVSSVYSKLKRLKRSLVECVQRHLERGEL
jgi:RNA polymerase sigma-70 factor (ECF subfamily)